MISMTCSCGVEFWVRDRLAGQVVRCPSCEKPSVVPPLDAVRALMTGISCSCGEVFWSPNWRPGKRSKCPLCGGMITDPNTVSETIEHPLASEGGRSASTTSLSSATRGSNVASATSNPPSAPSREAVPKPRSRSSRSRRAALVAGVGSVAVLAIGLVVWAGMQGTRGGASQAAGQGLGQVLAQKVQEPPPDPPDKSRPTPGTESPGSGSSETDPEGAAEQAPPPQEPADRLGLIVPAYFYPSGPGLEEWERLISAAIRVPVVAIVNPATGPGNEPDPGYASVIRNAARRGVVPLGYVNTEYARRPQDEILDEIERWSRFYPEVQGIFFDAQATEAEHAPFYAALRDRAKQQIDDALVVTNPGTLCDQAYFATPATDLAIVFETAEGFNNFDLPPWAHRYEPRRFAAIPYGIETDEQMRSHVERAVIKGMGYLYVTDQELPNPWGGLPEYWESEVDAVDRINQRRAP